MKHKCLFFLNATNQVASLKLIAIDVDEIYKGAV